MSSVSRAIQLRLGRKKVGGCWNGKRALSAMEGWEEDLDVDDSDLPFLRPLHPGPIPSVSLSNISSLRLCSQVSRSSQSRSQDPPRQPPATAVREADGAEPSQAALPKRRRIPGPAGAVQVAMNRQAAGGNLRGGCLLEEREGGRAFLDEGEEDEDFMHNPWLCALDFLGRDGNPVDFSRNSIQVIGSAERATKLVGIVKSCKSNGLGDLFVILKDPTGTIGASIHRKVLTDGNFGVDLSVGCVIILQQAAIFSPSRTTSYLNITLKNVIKIFGKDSEPPPTTRIRALSTLSRPISTSDGLRRVPSAPPDETAGSRPSFRVPSPKRKKVDAAAAAAVREVAEPGGETAARVAVPQWTDEELSLLFSDDQDLADLPL